MTTFNFKTTKTFTTTTTKIPGELEDLLKDEDQNGTPDFVDKIIKEGDSSTITEIEVNGKKYKSLNDVTSEEIPKLSVAPFISIRDIKIVFISVVIVLSIYFLTRYFKVL